MDDSLKKYFDGNTNQTENRKIFEWIKQSSENEKYFKIVRQLYDITLWQDDVIIRPVERAKNQRQFIYFLIRTVAVFLLAVGLYFFYRQVSDNDLRMANQKNGIERQEITASTGECVELVLDDGTKVWLNSKSTLIFPSSFKGSERIVRLIGEGYFDVAHDPHHPFRVETEGYVIEVLGTEFNIRAYEGLQFFEASLLKGSVIVKSEKTPEKFYLKPNERVIAEEDGRLNIASFNKDEFLWREGVLFLDNKTIQEILPVLEQYFDVNFIIEGNITEINKKYTGKFRVKDGIEHILNVLQIRNAPSPETGMIKIIIEQAPD